MQKQPEDCSCKRCQSACQSKPGWFMPGEAEKAAALLGLTLEEFFKTKLGVDWFEGDPDIFALAPALVGRPTGHEYPGNPRGACVLFVDGRCSIHAAKPLECREYLHGDDRATLAERKVRIRDAWGALAPQKQIEQLLGREPESEEYTGGLLAGLGFPFLN